MRTFKVIGEFKADGHIPMCCPKCETDAHVPTNGSPGCSIMATIGLGIVTDPAGAEPRRGFIPETIQCRKCKTVWTSEPEDVRQAV